MTSAQYAILHLNSTHFNSYDFPFTSTIIIILLLIYSGVIVLVVIEAAL